MVVVWSDDDRKWKWCLPLHNGKKWQVAPCTFVECSWNQDFVSGLLRTNVLTQNSRDVTKNSKGLETIKLPTQFWENPQTKQENWPDIFNVKFKQNYYFSYVNLSVTQDKTILNIGVFGCQRIYFQYLRKENEGHCHVSNISQNWWFKTCLDSKLLPYWCAS